MGQGEHILGGLLAFSEADKSSRKNFIKDATALLNVAYNRAKNPDRWKANDLAGVVFSEGQFSGVNSPEWDKALNNKMTKDEEWFYKKGIQISAGISNGTIKDTTGGADHYYNPKKANPAWGKLTDEKKVGIGYKYYPETYSTSGHSYRKETLRTDRRRKK